jgi:hypothetical protein
MKEPASSVAGITELQHAGFVMKSGEVVRTDFGAH